MQEGWGSGPVRGSCRALVGEWPWQLLTSIERLRAKDRYEEALQQNIRLGLALPTWEDYYDQQGRGWPHHMVAPRLRVGVGTWREVIVCGGAWQDATAGHEVEVGSEAHRRLLVAKGVQGRTTSVKWPWWWDEDEEAPEEMVVAWEAEQARLQRLTDEEMWDEVDGRRSLGMEWYAGEWGGGGGRAGEMEQQQQPQEQEGQQQQ